MTYQQNGTKEWDEKYVQEGDHKYVMKRVRTEESTGAHKYRNNKINCGSNRENGQGEGS
jgi:hypothetical protein